MFGFTPDWVFGIIPESLLAFVGIPSLRRKTSLSAILASRFQALRIVLLDVNAHGRGTTTGDEKQPSGCILLSSRARGPTHSGARYPSVNLIRTPCRGCAWHNGVWPLPRGEEHEKESQRFSRRP